MRCVAFSPDGSRLASGAGWANPTGEVKIWDTQSGEQILDLKGHSKGVNSVVFSLDGAQLATGAGKGSLGPGEVKVWDARTGQHLFDLNGHTSGVSSVAFSPNRVQLVSKSHDAIKLWDIRTRKHIRDFEGGSGGDIVAFTPDGARLASGTGSEIGIWDTHSGQHILDLKGHTEGEICLAFSPDGTRLASGSEGGTVLVWDSRFGQQPLDLRGHRHHVLTVAFSPDGKTLASGAGTGQFAQSGELKLWNVYNGQCILDLQGHTKSVFSVAFSANGAKVASGGGWLGEAGEIMVWDAQTGHQLLHFKGHANGVSGLAFSPDGRRLYSRDYRGDIRAWDSKTGQPSLLPDPLPDFRASAQTADGRLFAHPEGSVIRLIHSPDTEEIARRTTLTHPDHAWHWDEVVRQDEVGNHFAVAFHLSQLVRHRPLEEPWHQLASEAYARAGQPRLAALHLACTLWQDRRLDLIPPDPLSLQRAERAAKAGRWAEAADDFGRYLRRNPKDASAWVDLLLAQLGAEQKEASQRTRASILDHFAELTDDSLSNDLLWTCALTTLPEGDSLRLLALTERRVKEKRGPFELFSLGAAQYRAGHFKQAVESLEEALKMRLRKEWGNPWLFLAMAQQRLGKTHEAENGIEKGISILEQERTRKWREQICTEILRKEAVGLIRGKKTR